VLTLDACIGIIKTFGVRLYYFWYKLYDKSFLNFIILVAQCCTLSNRSISSFRQGFQMTFPNSRSRWGLTLRDVYCAVCMSMYVNDLISPSVFMTLLTAAAICANDFRLLLITTSRSFFLWFLLISVVIAHLDVSFHTWP